jgi:hypothetical protein
VLLGATLSRPVITPDRWFKLTHYPLGRCEMATPTSSQTSSWWINGTACVVVCRAPWQLEAAGRPYGVNIRRLFSPELVTACTGDPWVGQEGA